MNKYQQISKNIKKNLKSGFIRLLIVFVYVGKMKKNEQI